MLPVAHEHEALWPGCAACAARALWPWGAGAQPLKPGGPWEWEGAGRVHLCHTHLVDIVSDFNFYAIISLEDVIIAERRFSKRAC